MAEKIKKNYLHILLGRVSKYYKKTLHPDTLSDFLSNPYPYYQKARDYAPVLWSEQFKHWLVFDYERVREVLVDSNNFSSQSLETFNLIEENRDIVEPFFKIMGDWLVLKDEPRHAEMRAVIAKAFTPKYLASKEADTRRIAQKNIEKISRMDSFDFHNDFSVPFAASIFMDMLGVNPEDLGRVEPWIKDLALVVGRTRNIEHLKKGVNAIKEMEKYLEEIIEQRKYEPQNDIISLLVQANEKNILSNSEMSAQAIMLLSGGFETVSATLSGAALAFLKHKQEFQKLKTNMNLLPLAIEEMFRFVSPAQAPTRVASRDINFYGVKIKKGEGVAPIAASANRDARVFDEPNRFIIDRNPNPHLAMGKGIHHCVGASLSRMEIRIVMEEIVKVNLFNEVDLIDTEKEDWNVDNFSFRLPKSVNIKRTVTHATCPFTHV